MTPEKALEKLAATLREDDPMLAERVRETDAPPALGLLAAAGPRAGGAEPDYAFVVEAVREGYLLHYGRPRLFGGIDPDLALLAGDHLYAIGLECLAGLGDLEAVRELADLISLSAQLHCGEAAEARRERALGALWLATVTAVAAGGGRPHAEAKQALREGPEEAEAALALGQTALAAAANAGIEPALEQAADSIDFALPNPSAGG